VPTARATGKSEKSDCGDKFFNPFEHWNLPSSLFVPIVLLLFLAVKLHPELMFFGKDYASVLKHLRATP
jgi:hypothetical protein